MHGSYPAAPDEVIRSPENRIAKLVRSLRQRKARETEGAFVVEGYRAIADALAAGARPRILLVREGDTEAARRWFGDQTPLRIVAASVFDRLAETVTPQGTLAVFPIPDLPIPKVSAPLYLVLDRLRDPGNLGTLIRAAAAAGATAVLLTEASVDPFNSKVVRAAVGAHFRVPIHWLSPRLAGRVEAECELRCVADPATGQVYDEVDWTRPAALIVGSETEGVSDHLRAFATESVHIPLAAGVESLNAALAGAVILFEANRQRRRARVSL